MWLPNHGFSDEEMLVTWKQAVDRCVAGFGLRFCMCDIEEAPFIVMGYDSDAFERQIRVTNSRLGPSCYSFVIRICSEQLCRTTDQVRWSRCFPGGSHKPTTSLNFIVSISDVGA